MATFPEVLKGIRSASSDLFDESSRREPTEDERVIEVVEITVPRPDEFRGREIQEPPVDFPLEEGDDDWWGGIEPDEEDFAGEDPRAT